MIEKDEPGLAFQTGEKPTPPASILVFGASGQVGGPLVDRVLSKPDPPRLRLAASSGRSAGALIARYPGAEVVVADYFDLPTTTAAFEGMEAAFVIGTDFMDERRAMTNVAAAAHHAGTIRHVLRMTGAAPGNNRVDDLNPLVRDVVNPAQGFQQAREILLACDVPVSFVNCWAAMQSILLRFNLAEIVLGRRLSMPYDRLGTFLDPADIGAAAAELLLAGHSRHQDGAWHHLTGCERLRYADVAVLLGEELGVPIAYDDDPANFAETVAPIVGENVLVGLLGFMQAEYREEYRFAVTDTLPRLIGRPAKPFRQYIREHREVLLGNAGAGAQIREAAAAKGPLPVPVG